MVKDTLLPEKVVHNKKRGNYATKKERVVYRQDRKSNVSSQIKKHEGTQTTRHLFPSVYFLAQKENTFRFFTLYSIV